MVRVLFFARLREKIGASEINIDNVSTVEDLLNELKKRFPVLEQEHFFLAINQEVIHAYRSYTLQGDEEIALFPMVAGG